MAPPIALRRERLRATRDESFGAIAIAMPHRNDLNPAASGSPVDDRVLAIK
ncbi:hypothetical protein F9288_12345 [Sphingomonas sp. CL5.1]|uniref:hypothetical protein n=1 Tax=Sphingomonas sp. CL5.1 TaxID=2653203 RepID=UPI001581C64D|nr:hypothetical protein [Sphingomonas sp. CL5.1]QKS00326.1 hypothetical protein F9288_12345 [Sphingomonas sp. CL5.1]